MNTPKLIAHLTELITYRIESEIEERQNYWKYLTVQRPDYFWGNFLLFREEPKKEDFAVWMKSYAEEFNVEEQKFITFTWDSLQQGDIEAFVEDGFEYEKCNVLLLDELQSPENLNQSIEIREIEEDWEWNQFVDLHDQGPPFTIEFLKTQMHSFRSLVQKKMAIRYGAFVGEKLVGDVGIIFKNGLLRFNNVATHRDFRRQGICSSLVYEATRRAVAMKRFDRLVMLADDGEPAEGIYRSLGFKPKEVMHSLQKYWK